MCLLIEDILHRESKVIFVWHTKYNKPQSEYNWKVLKEVPFGLIAVFWKQFRLNDDLAV